MPTQQVTPEPSPPAAPAVTGTTPAPAQQETATPGTAQGELDDVEDGEEDGEENGEEDGGCGAGCDEV